MKASRVVALMILSLIVSTAAVRAGTTTGLAAPPHRLAIQNGETSQWWSAARQSLVKGEARGGSTPCTGRHGWEDDGDQPQADYGYSVGTAGVNGDGYADLIVGAYLYDNGQPDEGAAFIYFGSANGPSATPDWTAESDQGSAYFGLSVATAGDVNGDGYADVIVGAPYYDHGQPDEGAAFVYYGSANGPSADPDWVAEKDIVDKSLGVSVGTAGDVNGDGYSDVMVGDPYYDRGQADEGVVFVYYGSSVGLSDTANWAAESDVTSAYLGYSTGTAGDVNGDGYDDVILGAFGYDNGQTDEGAAFVYLGSSVGLAVTPGWTAESEQVGASFGLSAGTAGDINGDGFGDVIVGSPSYDNGQTDEGATFLYFGSAYGLSTTSDWTAESNQASASFGYSVGTGADLNGDGHADIIVGAPSYNHGQTDEGAAFAYRGRG